MMTKYEIFIQDEEEELVADIRAFFFAVHRRELLLLPSRSFNLIRLRGASYHTGRVSREFSLIYHPFTL